MRIVCQKCSSAYAIDDKLVTTKGVRAQCPRCRHLQLVKKEEPAVAVNPPGRPSRPSGVTPLPVPSAAPPPVPGGPRAPSAPPPVGSGPRAAASAPPVPSASGSGRVPAPRPPPPPPTPFLFDLAAPATAPASARASSPGVPPAPTPFAFDFGAPPSAGPGPSAPHDFGPLAPPPPSRGGQVDRAFDLGDFPAPPPPPSSSSSSSSSSGRSSDFDFAGLAPSPPGFPSGEPPVEEPDPALLDFVSAPTAMSPVGATTAAYPLPADPPAPRTLDLGAPPLPEGQPTASVPLCKSCGARLTDPFDQALGTCDDCRSRVSTDPTPEGEGSSTIERVASGEIQARLKAAQEPKPKPAPEPVFGPPVFANADLSSVKSAARERTSGSPGRTIAIIVGLAAAVGLSVFAVIKKPWVRKAPPLATKRDTTPRPVEGIVQQWRLNYPELAGESSKKAKDYVELGEGLLARDTTGAYRDAEEAFRKALVLDPSSDRAVAGWVLALAFGRDAQIDDATAKSAEAMLMSSEQRGGEPRVYVAHAHLLIARGGNPNDIRVLAERGKSSSSVSDKALAALAIGQTLLTKNPQQAAAAFRESLALDPKLKRGHFSQSLLSASLGEYHEAIEQLERRLELDRDQWEASEALARLYVEVGELSKARRSLEAARDVAPASGRPRITLAMLEYQHLGEFAKAEVELRALTTAAELPAAERADAWVQLAIIQRLSGEPAAAAEAIDQALELRPELLAARLQKFLVLVERGVVSSARLELDALKGKLLDAPLEATLEGRLLLAENRFDDALTTLTQVADADGRRVDALLLAGAAAARARKDGRAWELCLKRGLKVDPFARPVPALTQLYVRPGDLLKAAVGSYERLSTNSDEDPNPLLCEGMVAWFSEDLPSAEKHFARVNAIDPKNADAYAYRALIALARRDTATATRLAGRGADSSKSNALVFAAQGLIHLQANRVDAAKFAANAALKHNPALLLGKTILGEADARLNDQVEARRLLTSVLLSDPLYRDAKRVLYKQRL